MRHFLIFLFSLNSFSAATLFAQTRYEDVLYLKNGSILHGIIIEQVPNESIKIQTEDRNVFVYKMDEVLKITKEEVPVRKKTREPVTRDNMKKKGYMNILEVILGRSLTEDSQIDNAFEDPVPSAGLQTVNGYQFNPYLSLGLGIGIHAYTEYVFVPFFADVRINFMNETVSPFLSLSGGYSFSGYECLGIGSSDVYYGGTYFNPAFGVRFNYRKTKALAFSLGFRNQEARIGSYQPALYPYSMSEYTYSNYSIGYIVLKIGFIF